MAPLPHHLRSVPCGSTGFHHWGADGPGTAEVLFQEVHQVVLWSDQRVQREGPEEEHVGGEAASGLGGCTGGDREPLVALRSGSLTEQPSDPFAHKPEHLPPCSLQSC